MWIDAAKDALRQGRVLDLIYDGASRSVEVHAVGYDDHGNPLMRCWQVSGGGAKGERAGWKLMRLDKGLDPHVGSNASGAPRPGYKRGDSAMARIVVEL
jgi:hypothetical protein